MIRFEPCTDGLNALQVRQADFGVGGFKIPADKVDLKHPNVDFPKIAKEKPTEFVICEAAHFPATDYAPVLAACPTKQVLVNHYAPWNIPNVMQLAETLAPLPVKFVNDGMQITL